MGFKTGSLFSLKLVHLYWDKLELLF